MNIDDLNTGDILLFSNIVWNWKKRIKDQSYKFYRVIQAKSPRLNNKTGNGYKLTER